MKAIARENRFTETLLTSGHQTFIKFQTDDVLKPTLQVIGIKVLNDVRKRVAMENKSLELEQYSVSKPRNDNIVKHYGNSDHGKNQAFRKSFRKNTGFQNFRMFAKPLINSTNSSDEFNLYGNEICIIRV